ncbi:MAG: heavy-metal-associated domain-containing protein [Bacteroidota bacterium]
MSFCLVSGGFAQLQSVEVGIDGLTCSLCARGVEKSIQKLSFIEEVKMDLAGTKMNVRFLDREKVDVHLIAKSVEDAGFSVRYLTATLLGKELLPLASKGFLYENDLYHMIGPDQLLPPGSFSVRFIGKAYQSKKEFKKWKTSLEDAMAEVSPLYSHIYFITL